MRNERGFSLAELLVVVAVLGLILAGVIALQRQGQLAYIMGSNRVEAQQNARIAITLMSRELRVACPPPATLSTTTSSITFEVVDPTLTGSADCLTAANRIQLTYTLTGTTFGTACTGQCTLDRTDPTNGQVTLIGGVDTMTLTYYDAANVATVTAANIRSVVISLQTKSEESVASYSPGNVRASLDSRVRLRNL